MKNRPTLSIFHLCYFIFLISACSESPSIFKDQQLTLDVDAEVTECWITLSSNPLKRQAIYAVTRDDSLIFMGKLDNEDTLLHDTGLIPNTTYNYTAQARAGLETSQKISITVATMDSTSHNFTWAIDTIGAEGSWLRDITVISENEIWAVGRIELESGDRGNLARWDGTKWEINRVPYLTLNGDSLYPDGEAIFRFDSGEIVLATGARIQIWNGTTFKPDNDHLSLLTGSIQKVWGISTDDYYVIGNGGMILHYKDGQWSSMQSGTDISLRDIDGYGEHVFAVGYSELSHSVVLELRNGIWKTLFSSSNYLPDPARGDYGKASAVKVFEDQAYIVTKAGLIIYNYVTRKQRIVAAEQALMKGHDIIRISGQKNDLAMVGLAGHIIHYNGSTWQIYNETADTPVLQVNSGYLSGNVIVNCSESIDLLARITRGLRH